ncbi:MarR family winged helix-turn-helix transcriptional regulator [Shewanella sp. 0m-4]
MEKSMEEVLQQNAANWPECAKTSYPALLRLTQVNNIFIQLITECVGHYQLQPIDFNLLSCLRRQPAPHILSPTELYQSLLFSSGGLTKVLVRLQESGLIERCDNYEDKRSKLVVLSAKGKDLVEEVMPELHRQEQKMLSALSCHELDQLDDMMRRITQKMNSDNDQYPKRMQFQGRY